MTQDIVFKTIFKCPYCEKILGNKGQAMWHMKSKHSHRYQFKKYDLSEWEQPIEIEDMNDQVLLVKDYRSIGKPVPVSCKVCGEVIGLLDYLMTPEKFKEKYGSDCCLHCGSVFGDSFQVKQS